MRTLNIEKQTYRKTRNLMTKEFFFFFVEKKANKRLCRSELMHFETISMGKPAPGPALIALDKDVMRCNAACFTFDNFISHKALLIKA